MIDLHEKLICRQSAQEISRKRNKAARRGWWTQEDIDHIRYGSLSKEVKEMSDFIDASFRGR